MFIHRIRLKNILSFGPKGLELELKPLNVLIGPNGSGKSNFMEVLGLLKAAPRDIREPILEGGGCRRLDLARGTRGHVCACRGHCR